MRAVPLRILVLLAVLAGGCSSQQRGVLRQLPDPLFAAPPKPPRIDSPVARVPQRPHQQTQASAGWVPPGRLNSRWTHIVIHHSAGDRGGAAAFHRYHRDVRGWDELGYHFVIGNGTDTGDGQVEVGPRWRKQKHGAHCKTANNNYNEHGIGICLVGNFQHSSPSPQQMASLERLVKFLMSRYSIPIDHVVTHGRVTGKTACPGRRFPVAALKRKLVTMR